MSESPLTLRHVSPLRPLHWLRLGWADLRAQPLSSLAYGVVVAGIGWLLLSLAQQRPQYVPTALGLFFLLAPLIAAGLYELSRARAAGEATGFWLSLGGLRRNAGTIADFGVVLVILAIVWERAAAVYFALAYGGEMDNAEHFIQEVFFSGRYLAVVIVWCFSGAVVAALVFAVTAIGMPLVIDRQVDVVTAMKTSLQAIRLNLPAMLLWAALIVLLSGLGMAFALAGLIVVMPWLGHATWWAYRDIAGDRPAGAGGADSAS